jgi:hypothetical protein
MMRLRDRATSFLQARIVDGDSDQAARTVWQRFAHHRLKQSVRAPRGARMKEVFA